MPSPSHRRAPRVLAVLGTCCVLLAACDDKPEPFRCQITDSDPRRQPLETLCDGVDNDCDGVVDVLHPVAANACTTGALGQCGQGMAACMAGARACLVSPKMSESLDGLDNDCDGATDDLDPAAARPIRAHVMVPPYLWDESPDLVDGIVETLEQAGIPYTAIAPGMASRKLDWDVGFEELSSYSLVVMPGYVMGSAFVNKVDAAKWWQQLEAWIAAGGVLVLVKPIDLEPGASEEEREPFRKLLQLAGASAAVKHMTGTRVTVTPDAPVTVQLDSVEEREILVSKDTKNEPSELFTYTLDPQSGAVAFGAAWAGKQALGHAFVRRPLGQGAVYALGLDPLDWLATRCYINCFDPGRDVMALLLRGALREAGQGHSVVKHTVPGTESGVLLITHDVDAPDSHNDDPIWGEAGAIQMARMENSHGVQASYFVTTDYHIGYYNPAMVKELCALGQCPEGAHSVRHEDISLMTKGNCAVTKATYDAGKPTVCGEVVVSLDLLRKLVPANHPIRAWRSPYLSIHASLYEILAAQGVLYDSSWAIGDIRSNLPVSVARSPYLQYAFHNQPLYMFPIVQEDGMVFGDELRTELQTKNQPIFVARWTYALQQNLANGAWNTLLVHPSYGLGVGPENLPIKIDSVSKLIAAAKKLDVRIERIGAAGDFWRGRDGVRLSASWDPGQGYNGTLEVGAVAAPRFSLEFSDRLAVFECPGAGPFTLAGRRVVFHEPLPAGAKFSFVAKPG